MDKYISRAISYPKPDKYHLALFVPFYKSFSERTTITIINEQIDFKDTVTFEKGRYKIVLNYNGKDKNLYIEKTGEYIPEKFFT